MWTVRWSRGAPFAAMLWTLGLSDAAEERLLLLCSEHLDCQMKQRNAFCCYVLNTWTVRCSRGTPFVAMFWTFGLSDKAEERLLLLCSEHLDCQMKQRNAFCCSALNTCTVCQSICKLRPLCNPQSFLSGTQWPLSYSVPIFQSQPISTKINTHAIKLSIFNSCNQ